VEAKLNELKTRLLEINDLESAAALLSWDQTTYMPSGGAVARGRQMATLGQLAHEKFTAPAVGRLLDDLQPYAESLPYDSDDAGLLRVTRHDYERAVFRRRRLLDFIEHGATDRLFRWQDFVRDISNRQAIFNGLLGEPDVFSYRTPSNRRFSGC